MRYNIKNRKLDDENNQENDDVAGIRNCMYKLFQPFYDTTPDVLQRIQKGMSKQGITQILGSPQYRRFDQNIEEWEYTKVLPGSSGRTSIIVSFEGDKVVAMDSFAAPQLSVSVPNEVSVSSPTIFVRGMRSADFQRFTMM